MIKGKHLLWGALGAAGLAGGAYFLGLGRLSKELETVTKGLIHKVTLTGLTIRIDVTLKNPSAGTIKVKYPFVKLLYGESTLGSSEVKNKDFSIPQFGEVTLEPIYLTLGFLSLATSAASLLRDYRSSGKLTLTVRTVTTLNGNVPFSKSEEITIG
jgi:hypothetical protein